MKDMNIKKENIKNTKKEDIKNKERKVIRQKRRKERKQKRKNKKLKISEFKKLGISTKMSFKEPTEIQKLAIPLLLKKENVVGIARTGSGKTLAFVLPIIEKILENKNSNLQALIIVPTRELCHQIYDVIQNLKRNVKVHKIIGGLIEKKEKKNLLNCQILCATPGKLIKYFNEVDDFNAHNLQHIIIDEFDKMIEMNFLNSIKEILSNCNYESLSLFSATFEPKFKTLLDIQDPKIITDYAALTQKKCYAVMKLENKINNLYSLLNQKEKFIVFFSTTKAAKFHFYLFEKIFKSFLLTSDCSQKNRLLNFKSFDNENRGVLFTTDLSSRGLDFKKIDKIISFDCPDDHKTFIHRNGRANRIINERSEKNINEKSEIQSYLFLLKGEVEFLKDLEIERIENLENRKLNFSRMFSKSHLREFGEKYCKTYGRHLELKGKKYESCLEEISNLKKYLNL